MYTRIFDALNYRKMLNWLPDKVFLEAAFRARFGRKLNLNNPETFNEKLQWLKLYNRKPEYTKMVDKYLVRDYVKEKIGEEYLIPLLGVWDDPEKIDFNELPMQFVLKCNHNSGLGMCICKDKNSLDINKVKEELKKGINQNYYLTSREWPYKDVEPKIIAEQYTVDESGYELKDYKFFCFNGKPKAMFIATDRGKDTKFDFFDTEFHHLPFTNGHPNANRPIQKPQNYEEMLRIAGILSEGMPQVRVDLYNVNGKILFGEMKFFHGSGLMPFEPEEWDYKFGSWIELPEVK